MEFLENKETLEILAKPLSVYKTGGKTNPSLVVTIPKKFAMEMGLTLKKKNYVIMRLIKDNGSSNKNKRVYCIIERLD